MKKVSKVKKATTAKATTTKNTSNMKSPEKVVKKSYLNLLIAEAVAGVSLIASIAGYSVYLLKKSKNKKLDLNKVKIRVLHDMNKVAKRLKK